MSHDFRLSTRPPELLVLTLERFAETDRALGANRLDAIAASAHIAVKSTDLSDPLDHVCENTVEGRTNRADSRTDR